MLQGFERIKKGDLEFWVFSLLLCTQSFMSIRKYECPKSMIFEILGHKINHFEKGNFMVFVEKVAFLLHLHIF